MDSGYITKTNVERAGSRIISMTVRETTLRDVVGSGGLHGGEDLDVDLLAPVDRQFQETQRVTRRCRVEDDRLPVRLRREVEESIERRHLLRARRVQLLRHRPDRVLRSTAASGVIENARAVRVGGRLGVDLGRPQSSGDRGPAPRHRPPATPSVSPM